MESRKRKHKKPQQQEDEIEIKQEPLDDYENIDIKEENEDDDYEPHAKKNSNKPKNKRRGRIIVRNLSFKTTEDSLREHFISYGPIEEIKLLRKPDGRLVGCGFVQFKVVQNAAKAMHYTTGKPFLGRPIVCDWALGKDTYLKNVQEAHQEEIKQEKDDNEGLFKVTGDKVDRSSQKSDSSIQNSDSSIQNSDSDIEVKQISVDKKESDAESVSDESERETTDEESEESEPESKTKSILEPEIKKPKFESNDVSEGKTVFIKNVPFSATNEDLKECMSKFGELVYALICIDRVTEHSKGTAFVKFKEKEDAEKCLTAGTELTLNGTILDCHRALSKSELENKTAKTDKQEKKDSRNLYLVKEGVILAGNIAAQGVSAEDMAKRLDLERWKTQMLRNLNMFVSPDRLVIYNIPQTYNDHKLRQLFTKHSGPKAIIREARIMRNLRNLDSKGIGESKGYGFVGFTRHEDALTALRNINNNPNIFSKTKRPIVSFSIENRNVLNARNKRLLKSKLNNPNFKNDEQIVTQKNVKKNESKRNVTIKTPESDFVGTTAKPGLSKLRSKFKIKTQAKLHHENLKEEKRKRKAQRQLQIQRIRQPKQKQNKQKKKKKIESDNFSKLVNDYKRKLLASTATKKSKWYET